VRHFRSRVPVSGRTADQAPACGAALSPRMALHTVACRLTVPRLTVVRTLASGVPGCRVEQLIRDFLGSARA